MMKSQMIAACLLTLGACAPLVDGTNVHTGVLDDPANVGANEGQPKACPPNHSYHAPSKACVLNPGT